jgi:murein DD-endopeptidase MepM/ murein hydrolase activator NlpD
MRPPRPYLPNKSGIEIGETVTVREGENVYAIAQDHNVSMRDIIALNDLKPPFDIREGQRLRLPTGGSFSGDAPVPSAAPLAAVEKSDLSPIMPAGVSAQALEPPPPVEPPAALQPADAPVYVAPPVQRPAPQSSAAPLGVLSQAAPTRQATLAPPTTTAAAPAFSGDVSATAMKWPVQGPILSKFGPKGTGTNNDGINLGAPKGSPVVAAAPGTVVYAGNDMKGFGNLVLIRHQGDLVTAYAHMDRVLVKRDSVVGQGDMIGTVGKTGSVSSPQLHFEVRQNNKPVDPTEFIKK